MMSIGRARSGGIVTTSNASRSRRSARNAPLRASDGKSTFRRADNPHVELDGHAPANPFHLAVLDDPEHLLLHRGRGACDFVEKQRSAIRALEAAHVLSLRSGERPRLVSEELGVEQGLGERGAVDLDEGAVPSGREVVQARREQLLARASLADHEAGSADGGQAGYLFLDFEEGRILTQDRWKLDHRASVADFAEKSRIVLAKNANI